MQEVLVMVEAGDGDGRDSAIGGDGDRAIRGGDSFARSGRVWQLINSPSKSLRRLP